jgi:putative transposase
MRKAFKFRLYPNRNQQRELDITVETHRRLYNACLDQRKLAYEEDGIAISYGMQSAWFKNQRFVNKWYAGINFSSAQATMRRLQKSYVSFFRRCKTGKKPGYPRFKAQDRFSSVEFPAYGDGIRLIKDGKLRVQHVGNIKVKQHREVEGTVKTATLKREVDKWYLILSCDLGEPAVKPSIKPEVGIDVGLEHFLTTSDGRHEPNPRYLKAELPALRRAGRSVSRKTRGGKNRRKAVKKLQKLHGRVKNLRHDHRHKTALDLCRRYGFIAVERLNIRGMLRNHRLARAIADAAWGGFLATLGHKAESAGVSVVEVDARGTSQLCSGCGIEVKKDLWVRKHICPHCGLSLQRDVNAARNILARALRARTGPVGANGEAAVSQEAASFR